MLCCSLSSIFSMPRAHIANKPRCLSSGQHLRNRLWQIWLWWDAADLSSLTMAASAAAIPVMLIGKDKETLGFRGTEGAKPLIDACISVLDLVQHPAHDDNISHSLMLQEIHLRMDVEDSALCQNTFSSRFRTETGIHHHFTLTANSCEHVCGPAVGPHWYRQPRSDWQFRKA